VWTLKDVLLYRVPAVATRLVENLGRLYTIEVA